MGLCSKCFRDTQGMGHQKPQEASPAHSPVAAVEPAAKAEAAAVPEPAPEAAPAPQAAPDQPEKPVQANRCRCYSCNKKVGLLGFECRCGYVYCSSHRHAADHTCPFDYAGFDRERLAKANPLVAASKLDKL